MRTCFIVLSAARTGSNLLTWLLNSHNNVAMYGEIFNLDAIDKTQLARALEDPITYTRGFFDQQYPHKTMAVGFKLFYDHLSSDYFEKYISATETAAGLNKRITDFTTTVQKEYIQAELLLKFKKTWQYLADTKDIKIIHLKRANKLETLVSLKMAFKTDRWIRCGGEAASANIFLQLHPEECASFFARLEAYETSFANLFKGHPIMDIEYEKLVQKRDQVMKLIFDFLELPKSSGVASPLKQITAPLDEIVTNFEDLKQHFLNTPWAGYFREKH